MLDVQEQCLTRGSKDAWRKDVHIPAASVLPIPPGGQ